MFAVFRRVEARKNVSGRLILGPADSARGDLHKID
jgi:hypothetical protein